MKQTEIYLKTPFSLNKTLMSEQCPADLWFLDNISGYWTSYIPFEDEWSKVMLKQTGDKIEIKYISSVKPDKIKTLISNIFSLDYKIDKLLMSFKEDPYLSRVLEYSSGLRIMRDINKEYRIIEAILTQNTSVKMIKTMQRLLFINYGEKVRIGEETIYTYPNIERIANENPGMLKEKCRLGYRALYLKNIAQKIISKEINTKDLEKMETDETKKFLMSFSGIGNKVSDLILMYGLGKNDVFPLDLWIKRAIKREYFNNSDVSDKEVYMFAKNYFDQYASIINLMIFLYERRTKGQFFNYCVWR